MSEIVPGDIVEFSGNPDARNPKIVNGVGVFIGERGGFEWFHEGESLGTTGSAIATSLIRRIGHDDDVNYARTCAATRSGRGSGFRSERFTGVEGMDTPEGVSEALSGDPVDSQKVSRVEALADELVSCGYGASVYESAREVGEIIHAAVRGDRQPPFLPEKIESDKGVVYVSGPMTGYDDYNFPAFNEAAADLRAAGWEVLNPADKGVIDGWTWADYLRYDLAEIAKATHIYTLPGWDESKGASLEMHIAGKLGIEWINPDYLDEVEESISALADECEGERLAGLARLMREPSPFVGETRVTSSTGGQKGAKPERYDLIPWDAMDAVCRVYAFGAQKYDDDNWRRGYDIRLSISAAFRHMRAYALGEDYDPESGEPHPAHAVFHMLAMLAWMRDPETYGQFDTRTTVRLS